MRENCDVFQGCLGTCWTQVKAVVSERRTGRDFTMKLVLDPAFLESRNHLMGTGRKGYDWSQGNLYSVEAPGSL